MDDEDTCVREAISTLLTSKHSLPDQYLVYEKYYLGTDILEETYSAGSIVALGPVCRSGWLRYWISLSSVSFLACRPAISRKNG